MQTIFKDVFFLFVCLKLNDIKGIELDQGIRTSILKERKKR